VTPTDAQWDAVKAIVAWYRGGRSTPQVFYLAGYAGTGKPGTLDSMLQTPDGPVRMGDIKVGDLVFSADGRPTRVVAIDPQGVQATYRVTFRDGFSTECGFDHLWTVGFMAHGRRSWKTMELREIVARGLRNSAGCRYRVPLCEPLAYPEVALPIDPWVLGYVIGEGYFGRRSQISISVANDEAEELLPKLSEAVSLRGGDHGAGCRSWRVHAADNRVFRDLGFTQEHRSEGMFIPALYRYAGVEARWQLLRGLMDAEGSSTKNRIRFSTTSETLAAHVAEVVQSLGGIAIIHQCARKRTGRIEFTVNVKVARCPFTLRSKAKNWEVSWKNPPSRCIVSVERVDDKPQQCIQVADASGLYLADACIVTHNSSIFKMALKELRTAGVKTHALATFTGKAASVLRKKGNEEAQTIHSLIYIPDSEPSEGETVTAGDEPLFAGAQPPRGRRDPSDLKFQLNVMGQASEVDLIGLDECSMVDEDMAADIMSFGKKVLVMGDPGQLPPVGRGVGFFSKLDPDVMLTEVHRQALESPILRLATMAREGRPIPFGTVDNGAAGYASIQKLTTATQHLAMREDTQPICGVHRVRKELTRRIRHARGFAGSVMAGERIICGKNDRDLKLFNGLQGVLLAEPQGYKRRDGDDVSLDSLMRLDVEMEDHREPLLEVLTDPWMFAAHFGDVEQPRMKRGVQWFDFGYVLTCHKSQGSEWPDVTVIDDSGSFKEDRHRWAYTAITRASDRLTILRR
jgi:exodeoxyribonuclease-5